MTSGSAAFAGVARGAKASLRGTLNLDHLHVRDVVDRLDLMTTGAKRVFERGIHGRDGFHAKCLGRALVMNARSSHRLGGVHAMQ